MKKTALYDEHLNLKAKMVDFNGWMMPISYSGILHEHEQVRGHCGIFDVSHMGTVDVTGSEAGVLLSLLTVNDIDALQMNQSHYTMMCDHDGNVIDDMICSRRHEGYRLVVNCSNFDRVWTWMNTHCREQGFDAVITHRKDLSIIAVQGPESFNITTRVLGQELSMKSFHIKDITWKGYELTVSRTGYTGECGIEIFAPHQAAVDLWRVYIEEGVSPIGLGARDTLRIEAGLPLYGHEIYPGITPFDLGYGWIVKNRTGRFIGADYILDGKNHPKHLYGVVVEERSIPRQGCQVSGVGQVTSGTFSPSLKKPVAMVISDKDMTPDSPVQIMIRNRVIPAKIVKIPFMKKGC